MRSLFDVSVLLALVDGQHVHHSIVHDWWRINSAAGWATCSSTQNGFVRILSQPSYGGQITAAAAIGLLARETARDDHRFWPDDIEIGDQAIFDRSAVLGPNQITDIYLLGLAVHNSGRFVTLDRSAGLTAVRGALSRNLVVVG